MEDYKANGGNVSELIKMALATYFGIDANENFYPYHYDKDGNLVQTEITDAVKGEASKNFQP